MRPLVSPTGKPIELAPVRPSAALRAKYEARLNALISAMQADTVRQVTRAYADHPPELATDASPAVVLNQVMRGLARKWQRRFDTGAQELARYFATASKDRVDRTLKDILKRSGFAVEFAMTKTMNDVVQASVAESVALIKSIPAQHLGGVQQLVMRSVQTGRDLHTLTEGLTKRYGVTLRRAKFIALDQNNKNTAALTRVRQEELGLTTAKWLHSAGSKVPRPEHVAFSGKTYDVRRGAYLEGKWVWPGTEPGCKCVSVTVVPGLD